MDNSLKYLELCNNWREFLMKISLSAAGLSLGFLGMAGCASNVRNVSTLRRKSVNPDESKVTFVNRTDQREAA